MVKVAQPNIYKFKHRLIWERANGPIPNGMALSFRNLDRTDCRLENLVLMTKAEMARYCQSFHKSATPQTNESCLLMAKIKSKTGQLKNA